MMDSVPKKAFCDLNIPVSDDEKELKTRIIRALKLGYEVLAINVSVNQEDLKLKSVKKGAKKAKLDPEAEEKESLTDFPEPPQISISPDELVEIKLGHIQPKIFKRLTLTFSDNNFLPVFNRSATIAKYDLLALVPTSTLALKNLLKSGFRADIIAFDPEHCKDVKWSRKLYFECTNNHMFFELSYAPMIRDVTHRRRMISQGHQYHCFGKSRNIILSSGAEDVMELRGPYDVANLGFLLGLNEQQGKLGVTKESLSAVRSGLGRCLGPYRAIVEDKSGDDNDEAMK